jgi:hypothetical protein
MSQPVGQGLGLTRHAPSSKPYAFVKNVGAACRKLQDVGFGGPLKEYEIQREVVSPDRPRRFY